MNIGIGHQRHSKGIFGSANQFSGRTSGLERKDPDG